MTHNSDILHSTVKPQESKGRGMFTRSKGKLDLWTGDYKPVTKQYQKQEQFKRVITNKKTQVPEPEVEKETEPEAEPEKEQVNNNDIPITAATSDYDVVFDNWDNDDDEVEEVVTKYPLPLPKQPSPVPVPSQAPAPAGIDVNEYELLKKENAQLVLDNTNLKTKVDRFNNELNNLLKRLAELEDKSKKEIERLSAENEQNKKRKLCPYALILDNYRKSPKLVATLVKPFALNLYHAFGMTVFDVSPDRYVNEENNRNLTAHFNAMKLTCHPDRHFGFKDICEKFINLIDLALEVLCTTEKRKRYNTLIARYYCPNLLFVESAATFRRYIPHGGAYNTDFYQIRLVANGKSIAYIPEGEYMVRNDVIPDLPSNIPQDDREKYLYSLAEHNRYY